MRLFLLYIILPAALCGCAVNEATYPGPGPNARISEVTPGRITHAQFIQIAGQIREMAGMNGADSITAKPLRQGIDSLARAHTQRYRKMRSTRNRVMWATAAGGTVVWLAAMPSDKGNDGMATGLWFMATPEVLFISLLTGFVVGSITKGPDLTRQEAEDLNALIRRCNAAVSSPKPVINAQ
jgi:hypothetical protein